VVYPATSLQTNVPGCRQGWPTASYNSLQCGYSGETADQGHRLSTHSWRNQSCIQPVIIIIIIIIPMTMFIVLSSWPQVIARVHLVHLMNVDQRQAAVDPQTKAPDLGCVSACFRQLASTTTIAIYYYYSARKLILIYRPTKGRRLSWPRHCRKGAHSPCPRL